MRSLFTFQTNSMLEAVKHVNNFSDQFREELNKKVESFGPKVRYRFFIEHPDPEPGKNGVVFPGIWTLPRKTFRITDPYSKKMVVVGMVERLNEKGEPEKYRKVQLLKRSNGLLVLDLTQPEDKELCAYLELHPYHKGSAYGEQGKGLFVRIDELKHAKETRSKRKEKTEAVYVAATMKDYEVRDFISALGWNETEDLEVLRNRLEEFAENHHDQFTKEFNSGTLKWRATTKRALDKQLIIHHPVEDKITFANTGELIAILPRKQDDDEPVSRRLAEFLIGNGEQGEKLYKRIEALVKAHKVA